MTANYSLQITEQIKSLLVTDLSEGFRKFYPEEKIRSFLTKENRRDRIYNDETTLLTMILTAVQQDKSLQNSVNILSELHKNNIQKIELKLAEIKEEAQKQDVDSHRKRGRPRKYEVKVAKSKLKEISTNTGSYTTARKRVGMELVQAVYEDSADFQSIDTNNKWKGMYVNITDGTYLQLQDTKEIRKIYELKSKSGEEKSGYPQALFQAIIEQGSGAVKHFELGSRNVSELKLISILLSKIKAGTLLLADDLYNSYAIFYLIRKYGLELMVPGKRVRNYKVIKTISKGDEIVEIMKTKHPDWLPATEELPKSIIMRRIVVENPNVPGKEYILYTTLLDETIDKADIALKYLTRWDIEISIREMKTLMDLNVIRSKTPEMVLKELMVGLIAYNLMRKIMANATENSNFSPQEHIVQKCYSSGKTILMDKKGRIYSRWSPGRYGRTTAKDI